MEEKIISFTVAKLAKEKGFNEVSDGCFDKNGKKYSGMNHKNEIGKGVFSAPTQSLLQKWLREKHGIHISLEASVIIGSKDEVYYNVSLIDNTKDNRLYPLWEVESTTYEKALEEGLQEGLNLI